MLATPPRAGEGVHNWLYRVARQLHAHLPAGELITLLETRVQGCGRHVPRHEIISAVQNSLESAWQPKNKLTPVQPAAKWPTVNKEKRAAIIHEGGGLVGLWEESRVRIESNESKAESIVDVLFPGNPLLCCGKSSSDFDTRPREDWRGELSRLALIVPSPMSAASQAHFSDLTTTVSNLQSDNSSLVDQTNHLQKELDKDDAALRGVAAVSGFTNGTFIQNVANILDTLNGMKTDLKETKDRLFAPKKYEIFDADDTNKVVIFSTSTDGTYVFCKLKDMPIGDTIEGDYQINGQQQPLILTGMQKNIVWAKFSDPESLKHADFIFTYYLDVTNTNLIEKVSMKNGSVYFDNISQVFTYPTEN